MDADADARATPHRDGEPANPERSGPALAPGAGFSQEQALAQGFAARAVAWAREHGAPADALDVLRDAAYRLSLATTSGHVCLRLQAAGMAQAPALARATLLASRIVGTPEAPANRPLILDADDRLYLHRYFDYERRLARRLMRAVGAPAEAVVRAGGEAPIGHASLQTLRATLDRLFDGNATAGGEHPNWQKIAVALALSRRLTVISGGPGTGKTTTVVNLLACLLAQAPGCRIALAAPTGKAAARMLEAIRLRAGQLPVESTAGFPTEAFTVHRLLGVQPDSDDFRHHAGNPLGIDVLVVDEASMLDLSLATRLLEAVPKSARIILLGDKDQLAAVEAGAVFSELCADPTLSDAARRQVAGLTGTAPQHIATAPPVEATPLHDSVVWLTENFRFAADSGIGRVAAEINAGDAERAIASLQSGDASGSDSTLAWLEDDARTPRAATMARMEAGFAAYAQALRRFAADPARAAMDPAPVFDAFGRFRVLCAEREGPRGVAGINEALARWLRATLDDPLDPGPRSPWYPGRPVMVLRNDYVMSLYNGDVGLVLPGADGTLSTCFAQPDGGFRFIAPARLPEHDTAFASTVHKAQGSEFDEVLLLLPSQSSRVVTRELLYTGVTRARQRVVVVSGADVLRAGIAARMARDSGLVARLRECDAAGGAASTFGAPFGPSRA
jgi:exodeoxyribonuclease V alpha subunit